MMIIFKCKTPQDIEVGTEVYTFFTNKKGFVKYTSNLVTDCDGKVSFGFLIKFEERDVLSEIALRDILEYRSEEIFCLEEMPIEFTENFFATRDLDGKLIFKSQTSNVDEIYSKYEELKTAKKHLIKPKRDVDLFGHE